MRRRLAALGTFAFAFFIITACLGGAAATEQVAPTDTPEMHTFNSPADASFPLALSFDYGAGWDVQAGTNVINLTYKGHPAAPESDWWGGSIALIDGALVHDPATATDPAPASPDKSQYIPWPSDLVGYFSSIPGAKVPGVPTVLEISGARGNQSIVTTPEMQPLIWLKGNDAPLDGSSTGMAPAYKRQLIVLDVSGTQVLITFRDAPDKYDKDYTTMWDVYDTLKFGG